MDNGLNLQLVHNFADQRKDEHFFMASGAFNLKKLNCKFLKNVSHLLNAPHFATSILIKFLFSYLFQFTFTFVPEVYKIIKVRLILIIPCSNVPFLSFFGVCHFCIHMCLSVGRSI